MYRGYKIKAEFPDECHREGLSIYEKDSTIVTNNLNKYIIDKDTISADAIANDWFPEINADVFISHSHKDEFQAICLAGWIKINFNLNCFIDSCVWNYSETLLNKIDKKYAYNPNTQTYNYNIRNNTTSNVYTILSTSILKMINKCEAFFLLGTPNSLRIADSIGKTNSPWIYSELLYSNYIRISYPERHRKLLEKSQTLSGIPFAINEAFKFEYDAPINHLIQLNEEILINWMENYPKSNKQYPLDYLYQITNK